MPNEGDMEINLELWIQNAPFSQSYSYLKPYIYNIFYGFQNVLKTLFNSLSYSIKNIVCLQSRLCLIVILPQGPKRRPKRGRRAEYVKGTTIGMRSKEIWKSQNTFNIFDLNDLSQSTSGVLPVPLIMKKEKKWLWNF